MNIFDALRDSTLTPEQKFEIRKTEIVLKSVNSEDKDTLILDLMRLAMMRENIIKAAMKESIGA